MSTTSPTKKDLVGPTKKLGIVALALAAVVMAFPALAGADEGEPAVENITITQHDSAIQGICLPSAFVLTRQIRNTSEYFELIVRASAPPCDPINASAVIYSMPGNGVAWPQRLVEKADFTISKAGTTTIHFTKTCDPVQFDVITGAAPDEISPEGEHHGPLLFPLDTETALQHWGCVDNSTTTTASTTTTTSSTSTTVAPSSTTTTNPSVLPTTSVAPTTPTTVLGIQESKPETEVEAKTETNNTGNNVADKNLAYTGSNSGPISAVGLGLAAAGAVLMVLSRRRATAA